LLFGISIGPLLLPAAPENELASTLHGKLKSYPTILSGSAALFTLIKTSGKEKSSREGSDLHRREQPGGSAPEGIFGRRANSSK